MLFSDKTLVVVTNTDNIAYLELAKLDTKKWNVGFVDYPLTIIGTAAAPIGGSLRSESLALGHDSLRLSPWQCIARARAIENVLYVITTCNIFVTGQAWGTFVTGPEGTLAVSQGVSISYATLDIERLKYLRNSYIDNEYLRQSLEKPRAIGPVLGNNRQRRPDLYTKLVEPQPGAYDYFYYRRGLES